MKFILVAALAVSAAVPALAQVETTQSVAQSQNQPAAIVAQKKSNAAATTFLPANTEVNLSLNEKLTTKGKSLKEGDTFNLTVVQDVMLGDYVIIPKGSRATGEVTWLTSKGMFGKSGKMEIAIRYVEVGGQRVPLEGTFRQEGEGNTVATIAGVVVIPIAGLFITGKSGVIPAERELLARTKNDFPVVLPEGASIRPAGIRAVRASDAVIAPAEETEPVVNAQQQQQGPIPPNAIKIEVGEECPADTNLVTRSVGMPPQTALQTSGSSVNYFCVPNAPTE